MLWNMVLIARCVGLAGMMLIHVVLEGCHVSFTSGQELSMESLDHAHLGLDQVLKLSNLGVELKPLLIERLGDPIFGHTSIL